jgi:hypothetical protein
VSPGGLYQVVLAYVCVCVCVCVCVLMHDLQPAVSC